MSDKPDVLLWTQLEGQLNAKDYKSNVKLRKFYPKFLTSFPNCRYASLLDSGDNSYDGAYYGNRITFVTVVKVNVLPLHDMKAYGGVEL
jgi:hypothetical protein